SERLIETCPLDPKRARKGISKALQPTDSLLTPYPPAPSIPFYSPISRLRSPVNLQAKTQKPASIAGFVNQGRSGIRTHESRICNPLSTGDNRCDSNGLSVDGQGVGTRVGQTVEKTDPELDAVTAAWPTLPPAIRAGIVAMVKVAQGDGSE
ncbi:MAG: hypothetical protein WCI73_00960, partial [Phycisphaerae bacterium]